MLIIDKMAYQSRWCKVDPGHKCLIVALLLYIALVSKMEVQLLECIGVALLTCHLLKIGLLRYLRWLLIPLVFLLMGLLGIVVTVSEEPARLWLALPLGHGAIGVDPAGVQVALATLCRSLAALTATYLLLLTTPFNQLIRLLQACHLPKVLIEHLMLTYRFIFILIEEALAIHQAQSLRFGYRSVSTSFRSLAMLAGLLLERVIRRNEQMNIALEMKHFDGEFRL